MTLCDLEMMYWYARQRGHQWVQLTISRKCEPKNWSRVRVLPGLYGKIRGHIDGSKYLADVTRDDLGEWLVKAQAAEKKGTGAT